MSCAESGGDTAWKPSASQSNSSGQAANGAVKFAVVLTSTPLTGLQGSAQTLSASVTGGLAPYKYNFSYTSNATSACANNTPVASSLMNQSCVISFSSTGSVSVSVTDLNGAIAMSNVLTIQIGSTLPLPTSPPTPPPTPTPTPTPPPTPTPTPILPAPPPPPPPVSCVPSNVSIVCQVHQVCADGTLVRSGGAQTVVITLNLSGALGADIAMTVDNSRAAISTLYSNLDNLAGYSAICTGQNAWSIFGGGGCTVDEIINTRQCQLLMM